VTVLLTGEGISLGIVTRDHAAMMEFYGRTLGLPHVRTLNGGLGTTEFFAVGTSMLKLVNPPSPPALEAPGGELASASGLRYITLRIKNLEAALQACAERNVPIVKPQTPYPGGQGWIAMVGDPDGNVVEFVQQD
jgi:catechol 2,3-dioxygenase-like lactoylglutathione lyase family enzyme